MIAFDCSDQISQLVHEENPSDIATPWPADGNDLQPSPNYFTVPGIDDDEYGVVLPVCVYTHARTNKPPPDPTACLPWVIDFGRLDRVLQLHNIRKLNGHCRRQLPARPAALFSQSHKCGALSPLPVFGVAQPCFAWTPQHETSRLIIARRKYIVPLRLIFSKKDSSLMRCWAPSRMLSCLFPSSCTSITFAGVTLV